MCGPATDKEVVDETIRNVYRRWPQPTTDFLSRPNRDELAQQHNSVLLVHAGISENGQQQAGPKSAGVSPIAK
jgi:hypothetical protein